MHDILLVGIQVETHRLGSENRKPKIQYLKSKHYLEQGNIMFMNWSTKKSYRDPDALEIEINLFRAGDLGQTEMTDRQVHSFI